MRAKALLTCRLLMQSAVIAGLMVGAPRPARADSPGCDLIPDRLETPCMQACCYNHDIGYWAFACNDLSWMDTGITIIDSVANRSFGQIKDIWDFAAVILAPTDEATEYCRYYNLSCGWDNGNMFDSALQQLGAAFAKFMQGKLCDGANIVAIGCMGFCMSNQADPTGEKQFEGISCLQHCGCGRVSCYDALCNADFCPPTNNCNDWQYSPCRQNPGGGGGGSENPRDYDTGPHSGTEYWDPFWVEFTCWDRCQGVGCSRVGDYYNCSCISWTSECAYVYLPI